MVNQTYVIFLEPEKSKQPPPPSPPPKRGCFVPIKEAEFNSPFEGSARRARDVFGHYILRLAQREPPPSKEEFSSRTYNISPLYTLE